MMHPDKRQTIILALAVAVIAAGVLAWRFNLVPEIGKFFAAEPTSEIWFSSNLDTPDLLDMFRKPELWQQARSRVRVFKFYEHWNLHTSCVDEPGERSCPTTNTLDNLIAAGAFSKLREWNVDIAIEASIHKPWTCGNPSTAGAIAATNAIDAINNIQTHGGIVKYIAIDTAAYEGKAWCGFTQTQAATSVRDFIQKVRAAYPAVSFGDIEPYPAMTGDEVKSWVVELERVGVSLSFLHIDGDYSRLLQIQSNIPADLADIKAYTNNHGMKFGVIVNGFNTQSDQGFYDSAMDWVRQVSPAKPEQVVYQTYWKRDSSGKHDIPANLPERDAPSLTRLMNDSWASFAFTTTRGAVVNVAEPAADLVLKNQNIDLVMSGKNGGAITSLKYRGLEVVDVSDPGRLIQAAWQYGDHGECANPTQAGNISDGQGPSSSVTLSAVQSGPTMGTVTTQPAWWIPPGGGSHFCEWQNGWWGTSVPYPAIDPNGKLTADSTITMRASITGKHVDIAISPHMDMNEMKATGGDKYYILEAPAIYLQPVFTKLYRLEFSSNTMLYPGVQDYQADAPVLCNDDDTVCMGWYSPDVLIGRWPMHPHHAVLGYEATDLRSQYGIWKASVRIPATESERTFNSHFFFGTKQEVQEHMTTHRFETYHVGTPLASPSPAPSISPTATMPPATSPPPVGTAGDVDGNKKVDIFDYNLVVSNFGKTSANRGDTDVDGDVDIFDYNTVVSNFGQTYN